MNNISNQTNEREMKMKTRLLTNLLLLCSLIRPATSQVLNVTDRNVNSFPVTFVLPNSYFNYSLNVKPFGENPYPARIYNFLLSNGNSLSGNYYGIKPARKWYWNPEWNLSPVFRFPDQGLLNRQADEKFPVPFFDFSFRLNLPCGRILDIKPFTTVYRNPYRYSNVLTSGHAKLVNPDRRVQNWVFNAGLGLGFNLSKNLRVEIGYGNTRFFPARIPGLHEQRSDNPGLNLGMMTMRFTL